MLAKKRLLITHHDIYNSYARESCDIACQYARTLTFMSVLLKSARSYQSIVNKPTFPYGQNRKALIAFFQ